MLYSEKVKKSKNITKKIKALEPREELEVTYGVDREGKPKVFVIRAYKGFRGETDYTIRDGNSLLGGQMNIEKLTNTQMKGYSFDMMGTKTTYNFPLYLINIV